MRSIGLDNGGQGCSKTVMANQSHDCGEPLKLDNGTPPSREAVGEPKFRLSTAPVVYHGTPLTPRAAFDAVMPGRAACVSFFRPDNLEAVLAVCPQVMFRPRGVFLLDASHARGARVGRGRPTAMVAGLLRVAGADPVHAGAMGDHARQSRRAVTAQRRASERLAVRGSRRTGLAHGRADRASGKTVRAIPARLPRLDRRSEERAGWVRGLFPQDGRCRPVDGQRMAPVAYAARDAGCLAVSVYQRGQHVPCAERASL